MNDISIVGMEEDEAVIAAEYIKGQNKILEWGSGGTTLYFPQFVKHYVSIEHDITWYNKIVFDVSENVDYHRIPIHEAKLDKELDEAAADCLMGAGDTVLQEGITYWNTRGHFDWHCGVDYINKPFELEHRDYDVVLVDGRCRSMCAYASLKLLKPGGILLFHDFIPRQYYHGILKYYDVIETQGTLAALVKRDNYIEKEEILELSDKLYNKWSAETGRIR